MKPRQHLPDSLVKRAESQHGVLSTAQLLDGGLSRDVISRMARDWMPIAPGLHLLGQPSFHAAAWAGLLRGGDPAVVGGRAAGYLHDAVRDAPSHITIWAPGRRTGFALAEWEVRYRRATRNGMYSLPRTGLEATLLDISDESAEDEAVSAVARALAKSKTTAERILGELEGRRGVRHSQVIRQLCSEACRGIESALEWRFHTAVLLPHGLPIPERQVRREAGRADGQYGEYGLIVELDGLRDHTQASRDWLRDNANAVEDDSRTLRYGWDSTLFEPCLAAGQVAALLTRGGWTGRRQLCPMCLGNPSGGSIGIVADRSASPHER